MDKAQEAFTVHQVILKNENERRRLFAENAALLDTMQERDFYKDILGDQNAPWAAYLGQIETYYSRSKVNDMIRVNRKMGQLAISPLNYTDIPLSRIIEILPILDADNYIVWFNRARTLLRQDWNIEVRAAKGLPNEADNHEHEMIEYKICAKCGFKILKTDESHTHEDANGDVE